MKLLLVEDDPVDAEGVRRMLRLDGARGSFEYASIEVVWSDHLSAGLRRLDSADRFDLVLLDLGLPDSEGLQSLGQILEKCPELPVVVLSGLEDEKRAIEAVRNGAQDYLVKSELHRTMLIRVMRYAIERKKVDEALRRSTEETIATRDLAVFALAKLADSRDPETGEHLERMRDYAQVLAMHLSKNGPYQDVIDEEFLRDLYRSSPLHDIGKVGIPDAILLKPGQLTDREFQVMKRHTLIGAETLERIAEQTRTGDFLIMGAQIARYHHERFDGSGYPEGLRGQEIPLAARIVALADVYDAITSARVYKAAFEPHVARSMIESDEGKHFDPAVVEAFRSCWDEFLKVTETMAPLTA